MTRKSEDKILVAYTVCCVIFIGSLLLGRGIEFASRFLDGPGQAGHVGPGFWMLSLPFIFAAGLGLGVIKIGGALLAIWAFFKGSRGPSFLLITALLFLITGWTGAGGLLGYLTNWVHRQLVTGHDDLGSKFNKLS